MRHGAVVVLAAGASGRMGSPKPLLPYGQSTFLATILSRLNEAGAQALRWRGVVVSSALRETLSGLCASHGWPVLVNESPETGQLGSIRVALAHGAAAEPHLMVCLADLPGVAATTYAALLDAAELRTLLVPSHRGRRGHPVIFPQVCYPDLAVAPLDQGARWVVARHRHRRVELETDDEQVLRDFDTPEDLRKIEEPGLTTWLCET